MSESTFGADLDALVRGAPVASNDDLTRFVTDLYGEEQNVTMPNALKLRIANDLGLTVADDPTRESAPVSRRTLRASEEQRRSSRPWAIAFAIAAAVLLALTGILRWGMPTGNDEQDNRFLFSSPAVPTISATPSASPESTSEWWMTPYTDADCPEEELLERGEWMEVQDERAQSYSGEEREDEPYSIPDSDDAEAAVLRNRQAMACINRGESVVDRVDALPNESPRKAWENSAHADETREARYYERLQRSKLFSSYTEDTLGFTAIDLIFQSQGESGLIWNPANAVQMADGRIALIPGWVTNSEIDGSHFEGWAPVWQLVDGEWLLDEELFFCIGDCEEYWEQRASVFPDATPIASPESTPVADQSWMQPITPEECVIEDSGELPDAAPEDFDAYPAREYTVVGPADPADAYAANDVARQYFACGYPPVLLSERAAIEAALSGDEFSPYSVVTLDRQLIDGIALSSQLQEHGVTLEDTVVPSNQDDIGEAGYVIPSPELTFALEDGRVVVMSVIVSSDSDGWIGTAMILTNEDGVWMVDDQVPVCIGQCDDTFSELESIYTNALWLMPISVEECERNAYLPADISESSAAAVKSRQYIACEMGGDSSPLQDPDHQLTEREDARPLSKEIESLHRANDQTPASLQRIAQTYLWSEDVELPTDPWTVFQPGSVVTLDDGRVAVLETTVVTPEGVAGSGRTSPVVTTALVWNVNGDSWLLDEEVTVCLGDCDAFWGDEPVATPESTPVAVVIPETCDASDEFAADFISHDRMVTIVRPGPSHASGVQIGVLGFNTPLQYLCEAEETTNPTVDRMDAGKRWLLVRAEDGTEGWVREVDVRNLAP